MHRAEDGWMVERKMVEREREMGVFVDDSKLLVF